MSEKFSGLLSCSFGARAGGEGRELLAKLYRYICAAVKKGVV